MDKIPAESGSIEQHIVLQKRAFIVSLTSYLINR